jgi:hypothetical protein
LEESRASVRKTHSATRTPADLAEKNRDARYLHVRTEGCVECATLRSADKLFVRLISLCNFLTSREPTWRESPTRAVATYQSRRLLGVLPGSSHHQAFEFLDGFFFRNAANKSNFSGQALKCQCVKLPFAVALA